MGLISSIAAAFDPSTLRRVNVSHGQANRISQVRLTLRNPASGESFVVNHPPSPKTLGSPLEMERVFYGQHPGGSIPGRVDLLAGQQQNRGVRGTQGQRRRSAPMGPGHPGPRDLDRSGAMYNANNFIVTGLSLSAVPWTSPR